MPIACPIGSRQSGRTKEAQGTGTEIRFFVIFKERRKEKGQQAVQENVEMQVTVGIAPCKSHFDIGNRPIPGEIAPPAQWEN